MGASTNLTVCAHCGRENDAASRFCKDCGKSLAPSGSGRTVSPSGASQAGGASPRPLAVLDCPSCQSPVPLGLPFCPNCGSRVMSGGAGPACPLCGMPAPPSAKFCGGCGTKLGSSGGAAKTPVSARGELHLIDESGEISGRYPLTNEETTIGRSSGDIAFPDDEFMSPLHAQISARDGGLKLRDLGSRNGTWYFIEGPYRMSDGDMLLIGSQLLRFRRLGYPGPTPPERDATRRMGSLVPTADIASLTQLRSDQSPRDVLHLSPGRAITLGRERADWLFPYDPSMSGTHAQIRSEDADFVIVDAGSRNGVAVAVRGEMDLRQGSRILVGDKLLRVELP